MISRRTFTIAGLFSVIPFGMCWARNKRFQYLHVGQEVIKIPLKYRNIEIDLWEFEKENGPLQIPKTMYFGPTATRHSMLYQECVIKCITPTDYIACPFTQVPSSRLVKAIRETIDVLLHDDSGNSNRRMCIVGYTKDTQKIAICAYED